MYLQHPNQITGIENLELLARQVVEGFIIGLHKSPYHGFSVEFAEHRLYNPGESSRTIDWKVFARTDKMFVKKFEEETNLRCQLVVDHSSSMHLQTSGASPVSKLQYAAICAASIMQMLKKQRDAAGLSLFSDKLEIHTECRTSPKHFQLLTNYLQQLMVEKTTQKTTSIASVLHQLAEAVHRRSMIIIFSDMFSQFSEESEQEIFSALQHLKYNKHEVILFHVMDKAVELDFEFENRPYLFVDLESGEKVKLSSNEVKEAYTRKTTEYLAHLKDRCLQYKIDFVPVDINQNFSQVLLPFFLQRGKMK